MKKIIIPFVIIFFLLLNTVSYAGMNVNAITGSTSFGEAGKLNEIRGNAIAVVQVIGVSIAIIMLIGVGIKYMLSAPDDRAEIKKHLVPYVVGAVFIFGSVGIIQLIRGFATNMSGVIGSSVDSTPTASIAAVTVASDANTVTTVHV